MKYFLILSTLLFVPVIFGQKRGKKEKKAQTLWVETEDVILQGSISFESIPTLFVGQEYHFTIISNKKEYDLEIEYNNFAMSLDEYTKKGTGGLGFSVVPLDTGDCSIMVSVATNKKREATLVLKTFRAAAYTMPPVFISSYRSGEVIEQLPDSAQLSCKYGPEYGIFKDYPVTSWKATFGNNEFSGTGNTLSQQLIDAVNQSSTKEVLQLSVEVEENRTGFKTSEAVFIVK